MYRLIGGVDDPDLSAILDSRVCLLLWRWKGLGRSKGVHGPAPPTAVFDDAIWLLQLNLRVRGVYGLANWGANRLSVDNPFIDLVDHCPVVDVYVFVKIDVC